jgi:two-component system, cell cycle response regulator
VSERGTRSKPRRAGTKSGRASAIPEGLAEAAEAALDDLLVTTAPVIKQDLVVDEEPITSAVPRTATENLEGIEPEEERVLTELPVLRVAIYETPPHLRAAESTIAAAGHVVAIAASGRDGQARVLDAVRSGAIDAVLVSLPGGEPIIDAALALEPRRPVVIASVEAEPLAAVQRAQATGADLVARKPHELAGIAPLMLATSRLSLERHVALAARGAEQVLRARLDELADPEPRGLLPFEMFQRVLELELKRAKRFEYPLSVALFAVEVPPPPPPAGILGILRARAGNALINTVRDIDIATQLDHERFLVLLPYTDLKGSGRLARRVLTAVAAGDPVSSGGRSFAPRVIGACAGAQPGQPVSFAKLMKDASRALDEARRDGADLAVPV